MTDLPRAVMPDQELTAILYEAAGRRPAVAWPRALPVINRRSPGPEAPSARYQRPFGSQTYPRDDWKKWFEVQSKKNCTVNNNCLAIMGQPIPCSESDKSTPLVHNQNPKHTKNIDNNIQRRDLSTWIPGLSEAINANKPFSTSLFPAFPPPFATFPFDSEFWEKVAINTDDDTSFGDNGESSSRWLKTLPKSSVKRRKLKYSMLVRHQ